MNFLICDTHSHTETMAGRPDLATNAVASFFETLGETREETLSTYLISMLQENKPDALDLPELHEIVAGFCPSFNAVSDTQQHALLSKLVQQASKIEGPKEGSSTAPQAQIVMADAHQMAAATPGDVQHNAVQAQQADVMPPPEADQQADLLLDLYPGSSLAYLSHVLHDICHDRLEDAAHWLMDQENLERSEANWHAHQEVLQQEAAEAVQQEKAHRKQLLDKYHLQAVDTNTSRHREVRQESKSKNQVRYREGQVVTAKGEKYVVEKVGQDWDGGSTGKVVTKGKRGKGFV